MLWAKHGSYPRINRGVHKKAANRVGAPSLVWHLGIWRTPAVGAGPTVAPGDTRTPDEISSDYINGLRDYLSAQSGSISFEDYNHLYTNIIGTVSALRGNVATYIFRWHRILTTIRIEVHTEYITITSTLDASIVPRLNENEDVSNINDKVFSNVRDLFIDLNLSLSNRKSTVILSDTSNDFYTLVWDQFENEILRYSASNAAALGSIFADFRGVITSDPYPDEKYETVQFPKQPNVIAQPFRVARRKRPSDHRDGYPKDETDNAEKWIGTGAEKSNEKPQWSRIRVKQIWPFIECNDQFRDVEFSVSEFLGGRAIYATSLGPSAVVESGSSLLDNPNQQFPVLFFIHSYTDDDWQIGRLVDRLVQAGTSRLATVIELDALHNAGRKLDELETKIRETRLAIHTALTQIASGSSTKGAQQDNINDLFNEAQQAFADLNVGFMNNSVEYRTDRSVYYIEQFDIAVKALRTERIEGYQHYEEYTNRRLGGSFSYIRMMQARVKEAKEDMTSLYQYFVSENITNIALAIRKRDESIQKIQDFGELILLLVLLPYYLGYLLIHTVIPLDNRGWYDLAVFVGGAVAVFRVFMSLWNEWRDDRGNIRAFISRRKVGIAFRIALIVLTLTAGDWALNEFLHPHSGLSVSIDDH